MFVDFSQDGLRNKWVSFYSTLILSIPIRALFYITMLQQNFAEVSNLHSKLKLLALYNAAINYQRMKALQEVRLIKEGSNDKRSSNRERDWEQDKHLLESRCQVSTKQEMRA